MAWQPATYYNLKLESPIALNSLVQTGPQLGQFQSAGIGGITGATALTVPTYLPTVGNPHVVNRVYIDPATGLWFVSTG